VVGRECEIAPLSYADVVSIHEVLERDFANSPDPIEPRGIRDERLLESALNRPLTELGTVRKYPSLSMSASALFHSLIHNHAFYNGNKRTALVSLLVLLDRNGSVLDSTQDELFKLTVLTAQHRTVARSSSDLADREVLENARWIQAHSRALDFRERPLKWLRLKQRLSDFGASYSSAPGGGRALNIERDVTYSHSGWRGVRKRTRTLRTQVSCPGDGSEAGSDTIHKIRHDLELDNAHGVDSASFYQGDNVDLFISQYRRVLRRLATL
jgi:death-on-curing family protein